MGEASQNPSVHSWITAAKTSLQTVLLVPGLASQAHRSPALLPNSQHIWCWEQVPELCLFIDFIYLYPQSSPGVIPGCSRQSLLI